MFKKKKIDIEEPVFEPIPEKKPDNIITVDISSVKTLQIGYQAETMFLRKSTSGQLEIHEYIGYTAYEYLGKVNANRFKTTIRYGRREEVNRDNYVEIYIPESWSGELLLSTIYGQIISDEAWQFDRLAAETSEGGITLRSITAPRIRLVSSSGSIRFEEARGFVDLHCTSGAIIAKKVDGGGKLETSAGHIYATFDSLDNILECSTLNGDINLALPLTTGVNVDGISKRGNITNELEALTIKERPGNVKNISGMMGEKPYYNVKLSTINGNINIG